MNGAPLQITVLGSGTSVGVPTIGCHCDVCTSTDPRDNRLRPSILIGYEGHNVLVDTTPDFRSQALRAKIDHIDAIVFTHSHADHIMGLDDVRPFNFRQKGRIPIYASAPDHGFDSALLSNTYSKTWSGRRTSPNWRLTSSTALHSTCSAWSSGPSPSCTARRPFMDFASAARPI